MPASRKDAAVPGSGLGARVVSRAIPYALGAGAAAVPTGFAGVARSVLPDRRPLEERER